MTKRQPQWEIHTLDGTLDVTLATGAHVQIHLLGPQDGNALRVIATRGPGKHNTGRIVLRPVGGINVVDIGVEPLNPNAGGDK